MDLVQHGHHGLVAAGRAAEHLQALATGPDGVVFHHDAADLAVFLVGEHVEVAVDGLGPALLGVTDGQRDGVAGEADPGVFQAIFLFARVVRLVDDLQIGADRRQLLRVGLEHAHAHAAAHHQQVEQVVVGVVVVDDLKGAVVVCHGIGLGHRRLAHPERTPGQKLTQIVDVVVELFGLLAGGGGEGAVVFHGAAHRLPPELPAVQLGYVAGVGAGIDEGAQLAHGAGRVLVFRQEFAAQQALLPVRHATGLLLFHAIEDVRFGGLEAALLEQRLLHRVLNGLDVHDLHAGLDELGLHVVHHALHGLVAVLARSRRSQRHCAHDEFPIVINNIAVSLSDLHMLSSLSLYIVYEIASEIQHVDYNACILKLQPLFL